MVIDSAVKATFTEQTSRSQDPPIWGADGGLKTHFVVTLVNTANSFSFIWIIYSCGTQEVRPVVALNFQRRNRLLNGLSSPLPLHDMLRLHRRSCRDNGLRNADARWPRLLSGMENIGLPRNSYILQICVHSIRLSSVGNVRITKQLTSVNKTNMIHSRTSISILRIREEMFLS